MTYRIPFLVYVSPLILKETTLTVQVDSPWGTLAEWQDYAGSAPWRRTFYKSNGTTYRSYDSNPALTRVSKLRSANTSGTVVDKWWMPNAASALIYSSKRTQSNFIKWPKYGSLAEEYTRVPPMPDLYTRYNLTDFEAEMVNLRNKSGTEAMNKLNTGKMELAVTMMEMHKTINHLSTVATRFMRVYSAAHRGDLSALRRGLGLKKPISRSISDVSKLWLELQYAWNPLIMDVTAAFNIAQEGLTSERPTVKAVRDVKRESDPRPYEKYVLDTDPSNDGYFRFVAEDQGVTATLGCKTVLHATIESRYLQGMKSLGLINPLTVAWELTPFSFVFDWFVPVGTFLGAVTAPLGLDFVSGTQTEYLMMDQEIETYHAAYGGLVKSGSTPGSVSFQKFQYKRNVLLYYPFPMLYKQGNPMSTKKALTAASLFRVLTDVEESNRRLLSTHRI